MNSRNEMQRRFEDAKANNAIEGLILTGEEEALFQFMIDNELDDDASLALLAEYEAGRFQLPPVYVPAAAE